MTRINKCIELIEQNQAIFAVSAPELTYECGKEMSQTWADLIQFDFEQVKLNGDNPIFFRNDLQYVFYQYAY